MPDLKTVRITLSQWCDHCRSYNQNGPSLLNFSKRAEACEEVLHAAVEEMKKQLPAATDRGEHYLENEKDYVKQHVNLQIRKGLREAVIYVLAEFVR